MYQVYLCLKVGKHRFAVRAIDTKHVRDTEPDPKTAAWTTPEEIVATLRFLASDAADRINGARITLDGQA